MAHLEAAESIGLGMKNLYNAAIEDAARAERHEISKNLVAIVPSTNDLIWKNKDAQELYVLVVTWTDYDGYDGKAGLPRSRSSQFQQLQSIAGKDLKHRYNVSSSG